MSGMVDRVVAGGFVFLSAIRGRAPAGGFAADVRDQARQAFTNIQASLAEAGLTLDAIVKVTVYLNDLDLRRGFHQVWREVFADSPPARTVIRVADANAECGGGALFALDVIAYARADNEERSTR
jgi:2-iminobutanoate/2-iminopropanoate deaminase